LDGPDRVHCECRPGEDDAAIDGGDSFCCRRSRYSCHDAAYADGSRTNRDPGDTSADWRPRPEAEAGTCWKSVDGPPSAAAAAAAVAAVVAVAEPRTRMAAAVAVAAADLSAASSRRRSRCWSPRDPRRGPCPPSGH